MQQIASLVEHYWPALLGGILTTLEMWFIIVGGGVTAGFIVGWTAGHLRLSSWFEQLGRWFAAVVPALVLVMWAFYPFQSLTGLSISPFWTCVLSLTLLNLFA